MKASVRRHVYDDEMIPSVSLSLCQLACYDQAKQLVLGTGLMGDNIITHFLSSFIAVSIHASIYLRVCTCQNMYMYICVYSTFIFIVKKNVLNMIIYLQ